MARLLGAAALLGLALLAGHAAAADNYAKVLANSFLFYEAQQSGNLPDWNRVQVGKPGGWRHDAHLNDGFTSGGKRIDLSGGYYDAGDYFKAAHPLAWTCANLALSALEFPAAYTGTDEADADFPNNFGGPAGRRLLGSGSGSGLDVVKRNVKAMADWLVKGHYKSSDEASGNAFVGQVSNKKVDHSYFGRPEHHSLNTPRPVYTTEDAPGADLAAQYAACFAATATLFKDSNPGYAAALFKRAQQALKYSEDVNENWVIPGDVYQAYKTFFPNGYLDDQAWAAAWMCRYQGGNGAYCDKAENMWNDIIALPDGDEQVFKYNLGYDWDSNLPGAAVLMISAGLGNAKVAQKWLDDFLLAKWQDKTNDCVKDDGTMVKPYTDVCYTPDGLAWYSEWGSLRNTGNMLFIAALASKTADATHKAAHRCWVADQMSYILGSKRGQPKSFVIGYPKAPNAAAAKYPLRPHHRGAACAAKYNDPCALKTIVTGDGPQTGTCCAGESSNGATSTCCDVTNFMSSKPSPIVLTGAMVGGPAEDDGYPDVRADYKQSEVALDFNAGFTGAVAGLQAFKGSVGSCRADSWGPPTNCKVVLEDYYISKAQCGGWGGACPTDKYGDKCNQASFGKKPWPGVCCQPGSTCNSKPTETGEDFGYFWICEAAVPSADSGDDNKH